MLVDERFGAQKSVLRSKGRVMQYNTWERVYPSNPMSSFTPSNSTLPAISVHTCNFLFFPCPNIEPSKTTPGLSLP